MTKCAGFFGCLALVGALGCGSSDSGSGAAGQGGSGQGGSGQGGSGQGGSGQGGSGQGGSSASGGSSGSPSGGGSGGFVPGALYGECDTIGEQLNDAYFNSCEPGCGSKAQPLNADYLRCDDFEDGQWAALDGDGYWQGNHEHVGDPYAFQGLDPMLGDNDGWGLTIYVPSEHQFGSAYAENAAEVQGHAYARCGQRGAGTDCAATSTENGTSTKMMGAFRLKGGACVDEFYARYYVRPEAGYDHGHEKTWFSLSNEQWESIYFGNLHHPFGSDELAFQCGGAAGACEAGGAFTEEGGWLEQNQGHAPLIAGQWNFVEMHVALNQPGVADGTFELWGKACGSDMTGCTGTPTLVSRYTNVMYRGAGDDSQICNLWAENWSNESSVGEKLYDQLIVSRSGPIGYCTTCGS